MLTYYMYAPLFAQDFAVLKFNSFTAYIKNYLHCEIITTKQSGGKMKFEREYLIGIEDIGKDNKITNLGFLNYLEEIACSHL